MDDIDEKYIYKNALKKILELDAQLHDGILQNGYLTGAEGNKYFSQAIDIARAAISNGAMTYAKKSRK